MDIYDIGPTLHELGTHIRANNIKSCTASFGARMYPFANIAAPGYIDPLYVLRLPYVR